MQFRRLNKAALILAGLVPALLAPELALAYVGPGAGITMLGSLWGLILAVLFVIGGIFIMPFRLMRNKRKKRLAEKAAKAEAAENANAHEQEEAKTEKPD